MQREVTLLTPENIFVTYRLAGVVSRLLARLIDFLIQSVLLAILTGLYALLANRLGKLHMDLEDISAALIVVVVFLVLFFYATFFEMVWGGRTPGKRLLGLRVVRDGGRPITLLASVIRNALLFIDLGILPPIYLPGIPAFLFLFLSPSCKRIGDYAAGTMVIVEEEFAPLTKQVSQANAPSPSTAEAKPLEPEVEQYMASVRNLDRLTLQEYQLIQSLLARRREMELAPFASAADKVARPILQKLGIDAPIYYQLQFADVLAAVARSYAIERGLL